MIIKGRYLVEHIRKGKTLAKYLIPNGIVNVGLDDLLDVMFRNQTQSSTWYAALVDGAGFTAFDASDTMSSHTGWTEFTDYDEVVRQAWTPVNIGTGIILNTSYATYNINASGTVKGFFIVSDDTKSGTSGTLWSTAQFTNGDKSVVSGDIIKVQYQLTASA